jgi:hypothetical protein
VKTPILGQSYVARSVNAADNRMINLFPEVIPEGGKEPGWLQRAPGLRLLATIGTGPIRGVWAFASSSSVAFVVSGNELYKINTSYNATLLGSVSGSGPVSMADNGTQLFVACDPDSYIYNNSTDVFSPISDPDFPGAKVVGYLDGYFVFIEPNSQKIWVTTLLDGTSIDPLDFASAEGSPDGVVGMIVDHREVWVYGTNSVEVWYNTGASDFPLQRIQGAFNEIGCAATYSVAKLDNGLFWLGADSRGQGIVYRANGYNGQRISTHAVEWHIQSYGNISDAVAYTYQQDGHSFYVLTFPSANKTWVYDVAAQAWHERASGNENQYRHRSNCQMAFDSEIVVGDFENGNIYAFDMTVYADNGAIQKWLRSWRALPPGQNNLKRTAHHSLQLDCESGVGLDYLDPLGPVEIENLYDLLLLEDGGELLTEAGDGILLNESEWGMMQPQVMLRWSDDGGHTWSSEHWAPMGAIGQFSQRVFWRRLGMTLKLRDRVYEISGTDPVKIAIMGAELILSPTAS